MEQQRATPIEYKQRKSLYIIPIHMLCSQLPKMIFSHHPKGHHIDSMRRKEIVVSHNISKLKFELWNQWAVWWYSYLKKQHGKWEQRNLSGFSLPLGKFSDFEGCVAMAAILVSVKYTQVLWFLHYRLRYLSMSFSLRRDQVSSPSKYTEAETVGNKCLGSVLAQFHPSAPLVFPSGLPSPLRISAKCVSTHAFMILLCKMDASSS